MSDNPVPQTGELRVLHVEDNDADAELVAQALRRGGLAISVAVVQDETEFRQQLKACPPDVVIADYNLPQWKGMEALEVLRSEELDTPLVLVSGALGDVTAVECIKQGATDYVLKDGLARLPEAIRRALQEKRTLRLRRQAEEDLARKVNELARSNADLQRVLDLVLADTSIRRSATTIALANRIPHRVLPLLQATAHRK